MPESIQKITSPRQTELDYLRGAACLMVVFFHYLSRGPKAAWTGIAKFSWAQDVAQFGHLGVQLFFMISGYVIYKSAEGRNIKQFIAARFWRLFPAYWAGILLTSFIILVFNAKAFSVSLGDTLWNFTMMQEWVGATSVDGAYWSLAVELIFYFYVAAAICTGALAYPNAIVAA